jgi:hypothetical protein
MTPKGAGSVIQVWTNPQSEQGRASLVGLSQDSLYLAVVPDGDLQQAAVSLQDGRPVVSQIVPLSTLMLIEGDQGDRELTLTVKLGAESTDSWAICLADVAARDQLIDALASRLGCTWRRIDRQTSRLIVAWRPFVLLILFAVLTWALYYAAQSEDEFRLMGKQKAKGQLLLQFARWIGPTWSLVVGAVLTAVFGVQLCLKVVNAPMCITLAPTAPGQDNKLE